MNEDAIKQPPFETADLRKNLTKFLQSDFKGQAVGKYKFGVYSFFDYDNEPIYVGQTKEKLSTRIRRHLTNQRTDAVAMSVLDPFEVYKIVVYPIPEYDNLINGNRSTEWKQACRFLDALEFCVFTQAIEASNFGAILNEKDPPQSDRLVDLPESFSGTIVSDEVYKIRKHPDTRIFRRANTLARLAQVINERQVQVGLRKTLITQAKRLEWLARRRFESVTED